MKELNSEIISKLKGLRKLDGKLKSADYDNSRDYQDDWMAAFNLFRNLKNTGVPEEEIINCGNLSSDRITYLEELFLRDGFTIEQIRGIE